MAGIDTYVVTQLPSRKSSTDPEGIRMSFEDIKLR